jgi:uncharacterized protein YrrD
MRTLNSKRLQTRSGHALGKLQSIDLDADTGHLTAIHVVTGLVKGLLNDELVIAWNQVVEIHRI